MKFLTDKGVQHCDLKSKNCLVEHESGQYRVKLTDFGLSKSKTLVTSITGNGLVGTITHMAPELFLKNVFTEKCDVYSFGILMFEILSREIAFEGRLQQQIIAQVTAGRRPSPIPEDSPPELVTLMEKCWAQDPYLRPEFEGVVRQLTRIYEVDWASCGDADGSTSA